MAAPVGVTQALPGFYAGAVYAAGVEDTLVTVLALPAIQTPARHRGHHGSASEVGHTMTTHIPSTAKHAQHSGKLTKSQRGQIIPVASENANILILYLFKIPSQATQR